jgi:parvulin-like peptidyl-prolyl isomerase
VHKAVSELPPGEWSGPVTSGFGAHVVQLLRLDPATLPSFEAVRDAVEEDWRRGTAETLREAQFEALRDRYEVILPGQDG